MSVRKLCLLTGLVSFATMGALIALLLMPSVEGLTLAILAILSGIFGLIGWGASIAAIKAKPGDVVEDAIIWTIVQLIF